ncbi:hypothetical protein DAETH_48550 (plasmid) [Deinococcus aetherius]|uniref:Uncharacterized protein n=1 Tax=Deinococcus aetherius TaxID=200252 RepID=A0ABM8AM30_9DEIO|nr:hypothetical protein [Deinococcus aetherius]BDP44886.1 hypothetical protein DAETH_48550 [Deinococcus aetherius]
MSGLLTVRREVRAVMPARTPAPPLLSLPEPRWLDGALPGRLCPCTSGATQPPVLGCWRCGGTGKVAR